MKTAVSIPDDVYRDADEVAERLGWSRSQLYARALRQFLDAQGEDPVTMALNAIEDDMVAEPLFNAGRDLIARQHSEW